MGKPNYVKLRTNLRLAINRLKLLEKKKAELALKSRREIADYISNGKEDRARIRVEHIVREDYLVEGMEIIEMFCDLLLARFGLIERMSEMDPGLEEAIATIMWVSPRLQTDVQEMKEISKQLIAKYGKEYNDMCVKNGLENVNEKVLLKMGLHAPAKLLIENYMIEIAKSFSVPFTPDPTIMMGDNAAIASDLIELGIPPEPGAIGFEALVDNDMRKPPGGGGSGGGGGGLLPPQMAQPNVYSSQPPPFQPGTSGYCPGENELGGASSGGARPKSPGNRLPPPLPTNPPNSAETSPAGKGGTQQEYDDSNTYDYAVTPGYGMRGPPPAYNGGSAPNAASAAFSNPYYGGERDGGVPSQGALTQPGAPASDNVYVPVLPDVPGLPSVPDENVQSGKHNTDYLNASVGQGTNHHVEPGNDPSKFVPVLPDLPSVPSDSVTNINQNSQDVDFDDLTKRFEALKKKK